jgi:hypothetical protein
MNSIKEKKSENINIEEKFFFKLNKEQVNVAIP